MLARSDPDPSLLDAPRAADFVRLRADFGKRFLLIVDTEEEFDWSAPFNRASTQVTALAGMARGQAYFEQAQVRPLYVTDYPVVTHPAAREMMAGWVANGTADIGAHLHPWVNPPHEEMVSDANSYAGSLPEELERAKLTLLRDTITEAFGRQPIAYRAGRYGIGPNSGRILTELGFRVDTSVRSRFGYHRQYGPDFRRMPLRPWLTGPGRSLVELPLSTAYLGRLRGMGDWLFPPAEAHRLATGALSRLGLIRRVPLTPEGVGTEDACAAIDALLADGQALLLFSFHSPTLEPGHTPYVRSSADLEAFYAWWDTVLNHLARRDVSPASLDEVLVAIEG